MLFHANIFQVGITGEPKATSLYARITALTKLLKITLKLLSLGNPHVKNVSAKTVFPQAEVDLLNFGPLGDFYQVVGKEWIVGRQALRKHTKISIYEIQVARILMIRWYRAPIDAVIETATASHTLI